MKQSIRFHTYQFKGIKTVIIYVAILLIILAVATAWNLSNAQTPSEAQEHWILFLICFILSDLVLIYVGRMPLWVTFTAEGIVTKGFYKAKPPIKWESITEAGVVVSEHGKHDPFLYLTAMKLTEQQRADAGVLSTMKNTVTLPATKQIINELRAYYQGDIEKESLAKAD